MSVQRAQSEITSTEFVDWVAYLDDEEINGFCREDYYLANIAAEIRRSYVKEPMRVKLEDFLMKFRSDSKLRKPKKKMNIEERTKKAKAFWGALLFPTRNK